MKIFLKRVLPSAIALALLSTSGLVNAAVNVQCPGDIDGDAQWKSEGETAPDPDDVKCMHLIAGDSFINMSDGTPLYIFGYGDQTGTKPDDVIANGILDAEFPAPTIELEQGQEFYLSLTNVGTVIRPDLFDPHTVHFHGFPNAATVFDGVPEVSMSINMGATLTYYYNIVEPGTYLYHCHVEATEHMEMGMLGNLFVHPLQDKMGYGGDPNTVAGRKGGPGPWGYAYNDNDGTTAFDVEKAIQISGMDQRFHDASLFVQPLPFSELESNYPMINGRGYPDTIITGDLAPFSSDDAAGKVTGTPGEVLNNGTPAQRVDSAIKVNQGETLLLRISNVSLERFNTITAQGLTMQVIGTGARQMRGQEVNGQPGKNIYKKVSSINFGGGETHDILIDTADVAPGTYFLYSTELHQLANETQKDGGMMTEIVVAAAI